jgi:hypothetical protein
LVGKTRHGNLLITKMVRPRVIKLPSAASAAYLYHVTDLDASIPGHPGADFAGTASAFARLFAQQALLP